MLYLCSCTETMDICSPIISSIRTESDAAVMQRNLEFDQTAVKTNIYTSLVL